MKKTSPEYKEVVKILEQEDQRAKGAISWCAEDIIGRARDGKKYYHVPTKKEAQEMLEEMIDNHDCNYGITWDHIDAMLKPREKK